MKPSQLNLDDFPDSRYAAELRKTRMRLGFQPPLEQEYLGDHLRWIRPRVRIWTTLALMISLGFTVAKWLQDGYLSVIVIAHLLVILPISAGMAWLAWMPGRLRLYLDAARFIAPVFGVAVALSVANALGRGHVEDLASLMLLVIASFFFMGLLYRAALITGLAILAAFAVGGAVADLTATLYLNSLLFLSIAAAAGAIIAHEVERSYRKRYLEQGLIGELVDRDGLTGLKNRRAFDEHLLRVWQQSLRANSTLAVVLIDVDFFKPFNDHCGHQAGDTALRAVAKTIMEFARRPLDIAARYGGEEFAIISYDIAEASIAELAERLRGAVEDRRMEHPQSSAGPYLTVSVGVGVIRPEIDRTPQGLLQLADEALYEAKETGRNRCVIKGSEDYRSLVTGEYRKRDVRAG